jgi:Protease inhibitor Inh
MARLALIGLAWLCMCGVAQAQAPATQSTVLGESAKAVIGTWEFSNADRDKVCTLTFKADRSRGGFEIDIDKTCPKLFPLLNDVVAWNYPENDLLRLLDAQGKSLVEFSEVEDGIFEAPTPGIGVLFLQNAAAAGPPPTPSAQIAGDWTMMHNGAPLCRLTLTTNAAKDGLALSVKPGCDPTIARLNLTLWRIDRDELMLVPARGAPWRFEEVDGTTWQRVPVSDDPIMLVRQ